MFPPGPLPPQNLSLSHVTTNSALITWSRHPRNIPDGFVVNVTRGLNTRSRFLPNGRLGSYTLRELTPGQHYYVSLTSVKSAGPEQTHSRPQHLAFTTCEWPRPLPQKDSLPSRRINLHMIITQRSVNNFYLYFPRLSADGGQVREEREAGGDGAGNSGRTHTDSVTA